MLIGPAVKLRLKPPGRCERARRFTADSAGSAPLRGARPTLTQRRTCVIRNAAGVRRCPGGWLRPFAAALLVCVLTVATAHAQEPPPELTKPVNDFAGVIDSTSAREIEGVIRSLQQATGDVVVVATVDTIAPYADINEYAVKMFENRGRGIGERGRDNGLLIVVAVKDRMVRVEVGYELEQFITDGFAGETRRDDMTPAFRQGNYGGGLLAATQRIAGRIAEGRNVTLQGVPPLQRRPANQRSSGGSHIVALFVLFIIINLIAGRMRGRRRFRRGWGGGGPWSSGVGPFGGGFGGGFGRGGGFGGGFGGFGGFGGGRSGGGGSGGSW